MLSIPQIESNLFGTAAIYRKYMLRMDKNGLIWYGVND